MATLHVRNVPDALYETLRARAQRDGRSIGGQTVALLEEALGAKEREARAVRRRFRVPRRDLTPAERLGPGARRALGAAQREARALGSAYVGTEHLLLGLLREADGAVRAFLSAAGLEPEPIRARLPRGEPEAAGDGPYPLTPRTKKVLELGLREALAAGEDLIELRHVLVALVREGQGFAAAVLAERGIDAARVRSITAEAGAHRLPGTVGAAVPWLPGDDEYRVVGLDGSPEEWTRRLNELASAGWRLESVQPDRAVFRRHRT